MCWYFPPPTFLLLWIGSFLVETKTFWTRNFHVVAWKNLSVSAVDNEDVYCGNAFFILETNPQQFKNLVYTLEPNLPTFFVIVSLLPHLLLLIPRVHYMVPSQNTQPAALQLTGRTSFSQKQISPLKFKNAKFGSFLKVAPKSFKVWLFFDFGFWKCSTMAFKVWIRYTIVRLALEWRKMGRGFVMYHVNLSKTSPRPIQISDREHGGLLSGHSRWALQDLTAEFYSSSNRRSAHLFRLACQPFECDLHLMSPKHPFPRPSGGHLWSQTKRKIRREQICSNWGLPV